MFSPNNPNPGRAVVNGPFAGPSTFGPSTVSFGADAALQRRQRELALAGLDAAMNSARIASEPQALQIQRRNLGSHGTIESPTDFARREGEVTAANSLSPANPVGALRRDDQRHAIERAELAPGGPRSTEIANRGALERAEFEGGVRRDVADIQAGANEYEAELGVAQREKANWIDNLFGSIIPPEVAKDPARRKEALDALYAEIERLGIAAQ
jgi:hypothetical protein